MSQGSNKNQHHKLLLCKAQLQYFYNYVLVENSFFFYVLKYAHIPTFVTIS